MQAKKMTEAGGKARQRKDTEDRAAVWRDKRRQFKVDDIYNNDIDFLEFGYLRGRVGSALRPLLSLELTRFDDAVLPGDNYLDKILWRYFERDRQGENAVEIADIIGVPCWLVLFNNDASQMHFYNLKERGKWIKNVSWDKYLRYLNKLREAR